MEQRGGCRRGGARRFVPRGGLFACQGMLGDDAPFALQCLVVPLHHESVDNREGGRGGSALGFEDIICFGSPNKHRK